MAFSDSERWVSEHLPWQVLHEAANSVGDTGTAAEVARLATRRVPLPSITTCLEYSLRSLLDDQWSPSAQDTSAKPVPEPAPRTRSSFVPSVGLHVSRAQHDDAQWVPATTLGHNGQLHNQLDVGSFSLWPDGHPVAIDLGAPTYDALTFGPHRYLRWGLSSDWHSTPTIDGREQAAGPAATAAQVVCEPAAAGTWRHGARLEAAYPASRCATWTRSLELAPSQTALIVANLWSWLEPGDAMVTLVLPGTTQRVGHGVEVRAGARTVLVEVDGAGDLLLERRHVEDDRLRAAWRETVCRLLATACDGATTMTTTFTTPPQTVSA